jgi:hypothetical protein
MECTTSYRDGQDFVEVRGTVQAFSEGGKTINEQFASDMLRLTPTYIVSYGFDGYAFRSGEQKVITTVER